MENELVLSPMQTLAAASVASWWLHQEEDGVQNTPPFFYLAGYAGSGKTSVALKLVQGLKKKDGKPIKFAFAAFTGKASLVLSKKGCKPSSTIHKLIYKPIMEAGKPVRFELRTKSDDMDMDLLVLDECSMVNEEIAHDLLSFDIPILVLGDPGQLPPVEGAGFFTNGAPDFFFTEIHRQAQDSPILRLATLAREGKWVPLGEYGASQVFHQRGTSDSELLYSHDQVICGTHRTRTALNRQMRAHLKFNLELPMPGDKLICLRNNWEVPGMMNGSLWRVDKIKKLDNYRLRLDLIDWDDPKAKVSVDSHECFFGAGPKPNGAEWKGLTQFTYGYAITCHKAQGSQWDSVLVLDESGVFREDAAKWLYTAITRAAERITIIK